MFLSAVRLASGIATDGVQYAVDTVFLERRKTDEISIIANFEDTLLKIFMTDG